MTTLPTAPEALKRSIEHWESGRHESARYWLAVASELRAGQPQQHVFDPAQIARVAAEVDGAAHVRDDGTWTQNSNSVTVTGDRGAPTVAWTPGTDATAVLSLATGTLHCKACGRDMISRADGLVHRSTYQVECESAFTSSASSH